MKELNHICILTVFFRLGLITQLTMGKLSSEQIDIFLFFQENIQDLIFHANCLFKRDFNTQNANQNCTDDILNIFFYFSDNSHEVSRLNFYGK